MPCLSTSWLIALLSLDVFPSLVGHWGLIPLRGTKDDKGILGFSLLSKELMKPSRLNWLLLKRDHPKGVLIACLWANTTIMGVCWSCLGVPKLVSLFLLFSEEGIIYSLKDIRDKINGWSISSFVLIMHYI